MGPEPERFRQRALEIMAQRQSLEPERWRDHDATVQELHIHQIELELQNEALAESQRQLHAAQRQYFELYQFAPVGYLTLNRHGVIENLNLAAANLLRRERRHLLHHPLAGLLHIASRDKFFRHLDHVFSAAYASCRLTLGATDAEAVEVWVESNANGDVEPDHCRMVMIDITAQSKAEAALRESEERYRQIVETAQEGIWLIDPEGTTTFVNSRMADMLGHAPAEMLGSTFFDFMDEDAQADAAHKLDQRRHGISEPHEFRFRRKDGTDMWTWIATNPIMDDQGEMIAALGMVTDITARRAAERSLKASEARYRQIFENHVLPKLILDPDTGRILDANSAAQEYYGHDLPALQAMSILDVTVQPHDAALAMLTERAESPRHSHVMKQETPHGERIVEIFPARLEFDDQAVLLITALDVTEKHNARHALQEANSLLQQGVLERTLELAAAKQSMEAVFESSADAVVLLDGNLEIHQANRAFFDLFSPAEHDVRGLRLDMFVRAEDHAALAHAAKQIHATGSTERLEICLNGSGDARFLDIGLAPVREVPGRMIVASLRDVTPAKEMFGALTESEARYRLLAENVSDMICRFTLDGTVIYITPSCESITGYRAEELVGRNSLDFVHPDDHNVLIVSGEQALVTGRFPEMRFRWLCKDGNYIWLEAATKLVSDPSSQVPIEVISVARDVTLRLEAEAEMRTLTQRLELATEAVGAGIWDWNLPEDIVYWDERMRALYGLKTDEFDSSIAGWLARIHPDDAYDVMLASERSLREDTPLDVEFRILTPGGETRHLRSTAKVVYDAFSVPVRMVGLTLDMTEHKNVLAALAEERNLLRTLIDTIPDQIYIKDLEHRFVLVNATTVCESGHADAAEIVGKNDFDLAPSTYAAHFRALEDDLFASGKAQVGMEESFVDRDGRRRWALTTRVPLRNLQGTLIGLVGITHDITEFKRNAEALHLSERRLELAVKAGRIGTWDYDMVNDVLVWDDSMLELYGIEREDFAGTQDAWEHFVHPDDMPPLMERRRAALQGRTPLTYEFRAIRPDGDVRYLRANAVFVWDNEQPVRMVGVNVDITERVRAQVALEQALEQERELGELKSRFVSMASHEFRTPLAGILATAESLARYRKRMDDDQIGERLNKICDRVVYMRDILEDVLVLTKVQAGRVEFARQELDLSAICRELVHDIDSRLEAKGRIKLRSSPTKVLAQLDERLMRQAIDNVVANAVKYSRRGTEVSVDLQLTDTDIVFTVRDLGIGIPEDDLRHLFDPFHRARNVLDIPGTGLGLSITKQAVDLHGGTIKVESTEGVGTTVSITIPHQLSLPHARERWVDADITDA